jgi:hypothetical protein
MSSLIEDYFLDDIEKHRYYYNNNGNKIEDTTAYEILPCRVDYKKKMISDYNGNQIISNAVVMTGYTADIKFNDELILDGIAYTVKAINTGRSFEGVHKEIWV